MFENWDVILEFSGILELQLAESIHTNIFSISFNFLEWLLSFLVFIFLEKSGCEAFLNEAPLYGANYSTLEAQLRY